MTAKRFLYHIDRIETYISQILLVFFCTLVFTQIVLRNLFAIVLPWSEELSRFAFVWFVFFGASYATRLSAHNRVTIQFSFLPKFLGNFSMFITDILWFIFNCLMIYMSYIVILDFYTYPYKSPGLGIPMQYVYMIFPISYTLMNIRIVQVNIMKYILKMEIKDVDKVEAEAYEDIAEHSVLAEPKDRK